MRLYIGIDPGMDHTGVAVIPCGELQRRGCNITTAKLSRLSRLEPLLEFIWGSYDQYDPSVEVTIERPKGIKSAFMKNSHDRSTAVVQAAAGEAERVVRAVWEGWRKPRRVIHRLDPLAARELFACRGDKTTPYKEVSRMTVHARLGLGAVLQVSDRLTSRAIVPIQSISSDETDALLMAIHSRIKAVTEGRAKD